MLRLSHKPWPIAFIAIVASCQPDAPTAPPDLKLDQTNIQVGVARHRNFDDQLASLADELPGFGGLFFDSTGRLILRLTDLSRLEAFRPRITEFLIRDAQGNTALIAEGTRQADAAGAQGSSVRLPSAAYVVPASCNRGRGG